MLMIAGPGRVERPQKTARNRRATDAGGVRPEAVSAAPKAVGAGRSGRRSTDRTPQQTANQAQDAETRDPTPRIGRPYAPLVAQLIGAKLGVAQSRVRRRGSPAEAIAAYRHVGDQNGDEHALMAEA